MDTKIPKSPLNSAFFSDFFAFFEAGILLGKKQNTGGIWDFLQKGCLPIDRRISLAGHKIPIKPRSKARKIVSVSVLGILAVHVIPCISATRHMDSTDSQSKTPCSMSRWRASNPAYPAHSAIVGSGNVSVRLCEIVPLSIAERILLGLKISSVFLCSDRDTPRRKPVQMLP